MKIATLVKAKSTITYACVYDGEHDFEDYIEDQVYKLSKDTNDIKVDIMSKEFGNLKVNIYIDQYISSMNWDETYIYIKMETADDIDMDYDEMIHKLENDKDLLNKLNAEIVKFVNEFNESVKTVIFPKEESFIFKNDRFYIETLPKYGVMPEWINFAVDAQNYDEADIVDYADID